MGQDPLSSAEATALEQESCQLVVTLVCVDMHNQRPLQAFCFHTLALPWPPGGWCLFQNEPIHT